MIEAEEVRLKAEIDNIVTKINKTLQNIESAIPNDQPPGESKGEKLTDGGLQSP